MLLLLALLSLVILPCKQPWFQLHGLNLVHGLNLRLYHCNCVTDPLHSVPSPLHAAPHQQRWLELLSAVLPHLQVTVHLCHSHLSLLVHLSCLLLLPSCEALVQHNLLLL